MRGKVYLVGAGPGDPELLTLKGRRLLGEAEVVIYDFLAHPSLLKFISPTSETIYVGKKGSDHTLPQGNINQLIIDRARPGKTSSDLKEAIPSSSAGEVKKPKNWLRRGFLLKWFRGLPRP